MPNWEELTISKREAKLRKKLHNQQQFIKKLLKKLEKYESKSKRRSSDTKV